MSVQATFKNNYLSKKRWVIKDRDNRTALFDGELAPRDTDGDRVTVSLTAGSGRYTEAYYKHSTTVTWTHRSNIEDGDTIDMT